MNNLGFSVLLLHLLIFLILIECLNQIVHIKLNHCEMLGDIVVTVFLTLLKLPCDITVSEFIDACTSVHVK